MSHIYSIVNVDIKRYDGCFGKLYLHNLALTVSDDGSIVMKKLQSQYREVTSKSAFGFL